MSMVLLLLFFMIFISFPCLIKLAITSRTLLSRNDKTAYPLTIKYNISNRIFIDSLYQNEKITFCLSFAKNFNEEGRGYISVAQKPVWKEQGPEFDSQQHRKVYQYLYSIWMFHLKLFNINSKETVAI